MPAKNSVKQYVENGYYHLYNRGVEKRKIFLDQQDYAVFLSYLKKYLDTESEESKPHQLSQEIDLLAFCLMPNHFHLLVKQHSQTGITKLIRAVSTSYALYFNRKYNRVGTLFQGKYKAVLVTKDSYLLHLSRYIHLNPSDNFKTYPYSSYHYYLGYKHAGWVKFKEILMNFRTAQRQNLKDCFSYQSFIEDHQENETAILGNFTLED